MIIYVVIYYDVVYDALIYSNNIFYTYLVQEYILIIIQIKLLYNL